MGGCGVDARNGEVPRNCRVCNSSHGAVLFDRGCSSACQNTAKQLCLLFCCQNPPVVSGKQAARADPAKRRHTALQSKLVRGWLATGTCH